MGLVLQRNFRNFTSNFLSSESFRTALVQHFTLKSLQIWFNSKLVTRETCVP